MSQDLQAFLDIQTGIERIEKYTSRGRAAFDADELIQRWVLSHLIAIANAAQQVTPAARKRHPEVGWQRVEGWQHLALTPFEMDPDLLWAAATRELTQIKQQIIAILESLETRS